MDEVKYIPGDLVTDSTKKIYIVRSSKNDSDIYFVTKVGYEVTMLCSSRQMSGIPITPSILEANGWKIDPSENVTWYKYRTDKANLYICRDSFTNKDWLVCVGLYKLHIANIKHVHQLQHLLFGLGLDSSLKV